MKQWNASANLPDQVRADKLVVIGLVLTKRVGGATAVPSRARQQTASHHESRCFISVSSAPHARGIVQQNTLDHGTTCIGAMLPIIMHLIDRWITSYFYVTAAGLTSLHNTIQTLAASHAQHPAEHLTRAPHSSRRSVIVVPQRLYHVRIPLVLPRTADTCMLPVVNQVSSLNQHGNRPSVHD
jgi:hypothetical protein